MTILHLQITIKQWDKSQLTQAHKLARAALPVQHEIDLDAVQAANNKQIVIDKHGDDLLGNRLQSMQTKKDFFLIDRFRFYIKNRRVEYKLHANNKNESQKIAQLDRGWLQACYDWRYRVEHEGMIFWLYEEVTLNAGFSDGIKQDLFLSTERSYYFEQRELIR